MRVASLTSMHALVFVLPICLQFPAVQNAAVVVLLLHWAKEWPECLGAVAHQLRLYWSSSLSDSIQYDLPTNGQSIECMTIQPLCRCSNPHAQKHFGASSSFISPVFVVRCCCRKLRCASKQWDVICAACREGQRALHRLPQVEPPSRFSTGRSTHEEQKQNKGLDAASVAEEKKEFPSIRAVTPPSTQTVVSGQASCNANPAEPVVRCDFCPLRGEMLVLLLLQFLKRSEKQLVVFCNNAPIAVESRNQVLSFTKTVVCLMYHSRIQLSYVYVS